MIQIKKKLTLKIFSRDSYKDLKASITFIQNSSIDWTVVRIFPTNKSGKQNVKSGYINSKMGLTITRTDAASFMIDILQSDNTKGQILFICN